MAESTDTPVRPRPGRRVLPGRRLPGVVALVLALLLVAASASPGLAHSQVISVYPADGSNVPAVPAEVVVTFSETPQALGTTARVTGPAGASDVVPTIEGHTIRIGVPPQSPAGQYTVEWRITSADGHPVTGSTTFTGNNPSGAAVPGAQPEQPPANPEQPGATEQTPTPEQTPVETGPATETSPSPTVSDPTSANGSQSPESQTQGPATSDDGGSDGLSTGQLLLVGLVLALGVAAAVTAVVLWLRRR